MAGRACAQLPLVSWTQPATKWTRPMLNACCVAVASRIASASGSAAAAVIVQQVREAPGVPQTLQRRADVAELDQDRPQLEQDIEGLLLHGPALRQPVEDIERALEGLGRLAVGRSRVGQLTRLDPI